jgi:hypothetical protein
MIVWSSKQSGSIIAARPSRMILTHAPSREAQLRQVPIHQSEEAQ